MNPQRFVVTITGKTKIITTRKMVEYLNYGFMGQHEGKIQCDLYLPHATKRDSGDLLIEAINNSGATNSETVSIGFVRDKLTQLRNQGGG